MVKYSVKADTNTSAKAKGNSLKVHFKNAINVAQAIKGMTFKRATVYLDNVIEMKEAVAMNSHKHGRGRHAQVRALPPPLKCTPFLAARRFLHLALCLMCGPCGAHRA